jgi:hypothetical protein
MITVCSICAKIFAVIILLFRKGVVLGFGYLFRKGVVLGFGYY